MMLLQNEIRNLLFDVDLTDDQINLIQLASGINHNAFTAIDAYVDSEGNVSNYLVRAASGVFSTYSSTVEELQKVKFEHLDVNELQKWIPNKGKNSFATAREQFEFCITTKINSLQKTLAGDRSDAYRQGRDNCSRQVCKGISIDLETEMINGVKTPVQFRNGKYKMKQVRMFSVVMKKTVISEVAKKPVNSGSKVLMDNIIDAALNSKKTAIATFSLAEGKFSAIRSGSFQM